MNMKMIMANIHIACSWARR